MPQPDRRGRRYRRHAGEAECRCRGPGSRGDGRTDRTRSGGWGARSPARGGPGRHAHPDGRRECGMISSVQADAFVENASHQPSLTVRKAVMHDIPPILALINGYAAKGVMLPRTEFEMSEAIRDFTVVLRGEEFLG